MEFSIHGGNMLLHPIAGLVSTGVAYKIFEAASLANGPHAKGAIACAAILGMIGLLQLTGVSRAIERRYVG